MTAPFSDELNAALRQSEQGGDIDLYGGLQVFPQYHCCISGNTVGVYKDPVAILEVDDQHVCELEPVCVSFDKSFSATSTIVTWYIDWGDGYSSNGAWPPPASVCHPSGVGYTYAGVYTIVLTLTDLLGATDQDAQQVSVAYCPMYPPTLPGIVVGAYAFGACYTDDLYAVSVVWKDMQSAQLNVAGGKKIWGMKFVQNHTNGKWHVFAGTECGIWRYDYLPAGEGSWSYVVSHADLVNLGGQAFNSTVVWEIDCSLDNPGRVVGFFGGSLPYPWMGFGCVVSSDYFATIDRVVWIRIAFGAGTHKSGGRIVQGTGGNTMIAGTNYGVFYKSTNAGASWNLMYTQAGGADEHVCHTPYVSESNYGKRMYIMSNAPEDTSTDGGASWAAMAGAGGRPSKIDGSPYVWDECEYTCRATFRKWKNGVGTILGTFPAGSWGWDYLAIARDPTTQALTEALVVGEGIGGAGYIRLWTPVGGLVDRKGNWNALTGNVQCRAVATVNYGWPRGV